jgi:hypothetical protein
MKRTRVHKRRARNNTRRRRKRVRGAGSRSMTVTHLGYTWTKGGDCPDKSMWHKTKENPSVSICTADPPPFHELPDFEE